MHNSLAQKYLREVRLGDQILIYHTGGEKAIIGMAEAISDPYPDPQEKDDKLVVVNIKPKRRFHHQVTLLQIKNKEELQDFDLVRLPRLSVLPVKDHHWQVLLDMLK